MSFLEPSFLWALPLALLPLLLHLLSLRRARRLPFSDLALLRQVYLRTLPSSRLRQWLLLLVRGLLIASLALAFARPVVRGAVSSAAKADEEGLRLVLLFDASYSMGYRAQGKTRLERALKAAARLVGGLKERDRVAAGAFTDRLETESLAWASPARALRPIQDLEVLPRPTELKPALEAAYALLARERAARKGIVVLSDNARHAFRGLDAPDKLSGYDPAVKLFGLAWPEGAGENASVADAALAGGELKVQVLLSGAAREDWSVRLLPEGLPPRERRVRLEPGRNAVSFSLPPAADGGALAGAVELQKDGLPADDAFAYAFRVAPRPKVLVLYGDPRYLSLPRGGFFLKQLFPPGGSAAIDVDLVDFGRWNEAMLADYRAVVVAGFKRPPVAVGSALAAFARGGGGLWIIPESGQELPGLESLLPARLGPSEDPGPLRLRLEALPDPAPWRFRWKDFELERLAFARAVSLTPKPQSSVWAQTAGGRPLWVYGAAGRGRVLLSGASLDADQTNLALKPVFGPLLSATLGTLAGAAAPQGGLMVRVGQPFVREWPEGAETPTGLSITTPDRRRFNPYLKGRRLEFPATDRPGLYELSYADRRGRRREPFAVNLDVESGESDLTPQSPPPWKSLDQERLGEELASEFYGVEARGWFLCLALALLALETFLSRRRGAPLPSVPAPARAAVLAAALFAVAWPAFGQAPAASDRFFWTQLALGESEPYPGAPEEVLRYLATTTSIVPAMERKRTTLDGPGLFTAPFLVLSGRDAPPDLTDAQLQRLRAYLTSGGFLWVDDASGQRSSAFDRWARRTFKAVFPDADLEPIPTTHAVFRSFYLLRSVAGRTALAPDLEGLDWGGRTAVVYSRNDLLGAWALDALGQPLLPCAPGGEPQRQNAKKVTTNIVLYALTGTYKLDAVHQPFILEKLRRPPQ